MDPAGTRLSPKLPLVAERGFALHESRQPHYSFDWHVHDCAMLLWPRQGGLQSSWIDAHEDDARSARLARDGALLLPANTAHHTTSVTDRQHHAELYFAPELLRGAGHFGALRLDGATVAMLDALTAPALHPRSAEPLVRAIAAQLLATRPVPLAMDIAPLSGRMARQFAAALHEERPLPSVDAVACMLGVSTRQLQRACTQELGTSPVAVRRQLQAAHARALLQQGLPLAVVSTRLGFATSGHLTRLLRGA